MNFTTTTSEGVEGCNISYSTEKAVAEKLLAKLPQGWSVHFEWFQIMDSDVAYIYDQEEKRVDIRYNQNLNHWSKQLIQEVAEKVA